MIEAYDEIQGMDNRYHFNIYNRVPILIMSGKGSIVKDSYRKEYIDLIAGIAVNSLGHCHPAVVKAIRQQANRLIHCSNLYYNEPQARLAKLLIEQTKMDRVFFCNSGTEAVEGAIKLARKWASKNKRGGGIITMEGSFHGRSLAAVTATGQERYKKGFDPLPEGFKTVPFNDLRQLKNAIDEETCAVMIEPIQGEGGIRVSPRTYLNRLKEICDQEDVLLIFDEIQCGMGRTGTLFAYQALNFRPDIITSAKALGGGFPVGAVLANKEVASAFKPGDHGTTFGGNPLAMAAALASLSTIIAEELPSRARKMGIRMKRTINAATKDIDLVKEVRGKGLMVGIEVKRGGKEIVRRMLKKGALSNCTAGNVIRFVPPLNIPKPLLDRGIDIFLDSLKEVAKDG
jgi:predicted acetylornithine/succinylornithine family transaminase